MRESRIARGEAVGHAICVSILDNNVLAIDPTALVRPLAKRRKQVFPGIDAVEHDVLMDAQLDALQRSLGVLALRHRLQVVTADQVQHVALATRQDLIERFLIRWPIPKEQSTKKAAGNLSRAR